MFPIGKNGIDKFCFFGDKYLYEKRKFDILKNQKYIYTRLQWILIIFLYFHWIMLENKIKIINLTETNIKIYRILIDFLFF